ncbi:MAG: hypothetical protein AAF641_16080 [Pseudomonadota bacterium]
MSFNHYLPGKTNPHLPHDGVEIQRIPASAEDIELAKSDADDLVRQLMDGDLPLPQTKAELQAITRPVSKPLSKPLSQHAMFRTAEPVTAAPSTTSSASPSVKVVEHAATNDPVVDTAPQPARQQDDRPIELREDELVKQVLKDAFPPLTDQEEMKANRGWSSIKAKAEAAGDGLSRKVLIGAGLMAAIICVIWPFQVLMAGILALIFFLASMQLMRVAFFARIFKWVWRRYAARSPERAERIRATADTVASAVEQVLDYLPGALADRLALPDFSKPITPNRG